MRSKQHDANRINRPISRCGERFIITYSYALDNLHVMYSICLFTIHDAMLCTSTVRVLCGNNLPTVFQKYEE
jgi:hypothetical protein